ncbi:hypothetical protein M422DRAFT_51780 [Sphaerobolus stellatus SS14]|uniref:Uncharacterized protein n=1 Tax=Sphaerobolus stellatus (strain SS14) TaxID=990650 RepID=A0A0C9UIZ6_SPHS4|nr:hypothetical protein M422DRAFT_51780 [Sphaerobolus stellatus SS14]
MFDPVAEEAESSYVLFTITLYTYKQEVIIQHFARLLAVRWRCSLPDHDICLSTVPNEDIHNSRHNAIHYQLSQEELERWIDELVCIMLLNIKNCNLMIFIVPGEGISEQSPAWILHSAKIQDEADAKSLYSHASSESVKGPGYYAGKGVVRMGKPL